MRFGEMKVFDGVESIDGKEVRIIIAATSRRAAVTALEKFGIGISVRRLITYWTDGGRAVRAIAMREPGQAFAASTAQGSDFEPLPPRALPKQAGQREPKIPTDPEGLKLYTKRIRENSDENKRARGERRVSTWISKEAAEALDKLTGGSTERGAVQDALALALLTCAAQQGKSKRKAA